MMTSAANHYCRTVGPLTLTDFVRYQGASGDLSPNHHDREFARRAGHRDVFAPGLFSAALLADHATARYGPDAIRRFTVRFHEQVYVGDVLELSSRELDHRVVNGLRCVEVELVCRRGDTTVTRAVALFVESAAE